MNKDIVYFALECALKKGAQGARISYGESIEGTISTLNSEIDNIRNATSRSKSSCNREVIHVNGCCYRFTYSIGIDIELCYLSWKYHF